jgi:DHA2 family multidrug resistance protein
MRDFTTTIAGDSMMPIVRRRAYLFWNSATAPGKAALNAEVTRQASIIAYANDFKVMLLISLATAFLLLLLRRPPIGAAGAAEHVAME